MDVLGMKFRAMLDGTLVGPDFFSLQGVEEYKRFLKACHRSASVTHIEWRPGEEDE